MSTLYVVATPIGNLGDMTLRALETLKSVDVIFAEDTRVTHKLLDRYDIKQPLFSYREAAPRPQVEHTIKGIIDRLGKGESVAYVSDAGTPGVSDPGSFLVSRVVEAGFTVVPIPGASTVSTLMSISGLPITRLLFLGFLPKKKGHSTLMGKIKVGLTDEVYEGIMLYESPERIVKLLEEFLSWKQGLSVCLGRELTKMHEEVLRGSVEEVHAILKKRTSIKGEIALLVYPTPHV